MARVFHLDQWAATHESTSSTMERPNFAHDTPEMDDARPPSRFSMRIKSLPHARLSSDFSKMTLEGDHTPRAPDEPRRRGGFRDLFRRASISLKNRQRRHSHAITEERPQTAWHKLKSAASFQRHSRFLPAEFDFEEASSSQSEALYPIPGVGSAPPIIPHGNGGAAARATAAAQNEYYGRIPSRFESVFNDDQFGDRESGIGITAMSTNTSEVNASGENVPHVDFITDLPAELAIQVFAHLDHRSLRNSALVSRAWARVSLSPQVWRETFMREQTRTYAMSKPLELGAGLGLPSFKPDMDWKDLYRIKQKLEHNWRFGEAQPVYLIGHTDSIYCLQFDESTIISGSRDNTIRVWDMRTYQCKLVVGPPSEMADADSILNADGDWRHHATMPDDTRAASSQPIITSYDMFHPKSILCLQYDEHILVTGSSDCTAIVHDMKDRLRPIMRLSFHTAALLDLAFDDRYIVTCSKDVTICVWERKTGVLVKQLRGHAGPVNSVQLRGNTIVSCSGDFQVKLWNIDTGKNIRELTGHTKGLACSQFTDDSKYIASAGNDKSIRIWDANTGECLKRFHAHENLVRSLHIDSISGRLISGSYDQDIKVFDLESGDLLLEFPKWHASWVLGAKSDYRRIISSGQDSKILIMDFGMTIPGIERLESEGSTLTRLGL